MGRCVDLMVSEFDSGSSSLQSLGLNPGQGHCIVFLGKHLMLLAQCLSTSTGPGVYYVWVTLQ